MCSKSNSLLIENKEFLQKVYLSAILVGDKFIYTGNTMAEEFFGKTIEITKVVKENSTYEVSINGEIYPLNFNITMFHECILVR